MKNTPERRRLISLQESEVGMLAGFWKCAVDGYVWDSDVRLSTYDGPEMGRPALTEVEERGPWLRPARIGPEAYVRLYPVLKNRNLLQDFVSLSKDCSPDRIRRFANRWGLLGKSRMMIDRKGGWPWSVEAEPMILWSREAQRFRLLWETWDAVRVAESADSYGPGRVRGAQRLLTERIHWWKTNGGGVEHKIEIDDAYFEGVVIAAGEHRPEVLAHFGYGDLARPARLYVHERVTERLQGHVHLNIFPLEKPVIRFFPDSLLSAVYVQFALDLVGAQTEERECEFCHQPFPMRRKDQRFCGKSCRENAGYHRRKKGNSNGPES